MNSENKLTKQHLAAYLPWKAQFISELDRPEVHVGPHRIWTLDGICSLFGNYCLNTKENSDAYPIHLCKLILNPLDLTKTIVHKGREIVPILELAKIPFPEYAWKMENGDVQGTNQHGRVYFDFGGDFISCSSKFGPIVPSKQMQIFQKLHEWHFDLYGLIECGLAIDKLTLQKP